MNFDALLTTSIANVAVIATVAVTYYTAKKARREVRKDAAVQRGDILDNATGYTAKLFERITELEGKVEGMQKKIDEVNENRLKAERASAEWQIRFEHEHELRVSAETRAIEAETELRITGYRRRTDTETIHEIKKKEAKDFLEDDPKL